MLWRFSFASASNVEAILSRETPPSVEELMDEPEILNECKAQNNKLVTYLSGDDSVRSLLQWVVSGLDELDEQAALANSASFDHAASSPLYPSYRHHDTIPLAGPSSPPLEPAQIPDIPPDIIPGSGLGLERQDSHDTEASRARYPQIATEILTSDVWTISETIISNKDTLLQPFWDAVLPPDGRPSTPSPSHSDRERARDEFWSELDEERDRKREVIRGMWTRVNGALMQKRTHEMIRFIQSLPNIVDRMMAQIASPAVQDMLIRIVSAEEAGVNGVIEWLANQGLIAKLLLHLSPECSPNAHSIAAELLKSIITLCAPAPFNPNGGNAPGQAQPGTRDNRLIRQLVSRQNIDVMIGFMLDPVDLSDADWRGIDGTGKHPADPFVVHPLPSSASAMSSLSHVCNILVEIIRRNNSDFSEPHLFHFLRQRLMTIQSEEPSEDDARERMEAALAELSTKMGIVHLGPLITTLSARFDELHRILVRQRPWLGLDRFRVVELYAELLHSSNMSILNRNPSSAPTYTEDGILAGGLAGLEALGAAVDDADEGIEVEAAREGSSRTSAQQDDNTSQTQSMEGSASSTPSSTDISIGDRLKRLYLDHRVLPDIVDIFFEYPNNDFMHHVVYDLLQQILNGRLEVGANRDLVIELLNNAKLVERILDAQRHNDEVRKTGRPRLPYMGHIVLISEELVKFFARCPSELLDIVAPSFAESEWLAFVQGSLSETKERDTRPLAGGPPAGHVAGAATEDDSSDEEEPNHAFGEPLSRTVAQGAFGSGFESFGDREDEEFWASRPRHVDSSDEDDDDADWMRPSNVHGGSDDEDFGAFSGSRDSLEDDSWGAFTSNDSENPFGDDNFAPSVAPIGLSRPTPLTPHDWASVFDSGFPDDGIVVPDLGEDEPNETTWKFSGEDRGEDLPPSPTLGDPASPTAQVLAQDTARLAINDNIAVPALTEASSSRLEPSSASPIAIRTNLSSPPLATTSPAFSPPEPSLIQAASKAAPLGPGVSLDTHVNASGMLEKEVDGQKIVVPADEVVRGVEDALESKQTKVSPEQAR